jgi:putative ABC transport system permease protein
LPADNRLVDGRFWEATEKNQLSLEEGFAETMGIHLGDTLQFQVSEQTLTATVTSIRKVQWDSFNVNFFVLATPDVIESLPVTYITSLYLPPKTTQKKFISTLVREFPGITVFDVNVIMQQVRQIIERATLAIQGVFGFTLLAGLMVLYAAISASQEERLYESAILRTLGATRWQVLTGLIAEFATLGLLAGLLAAFVATGLGYGLATYLLALHFELNGWLWIIGAVGGAVGIGLAGVLNTQAVLKRPPLWSLRQ